MVNCLGCFAKGAIIFGVESNMIFARIRYLDRANQRAGLVANGEE